MCSTTPTTLKAAGNCSGRLIGVAVGTSHLSDSNFTSAAKEFDFATPENEMKWDTTEATRGTFNFAPGDQVVTFAMQNNMKVKGHTLVWHNQLPSWVTSLTNASDVSSAMTSHITNVVSHFKGELVAWDVVNEAWSTPNMTGVGPATIYNDVFYQYLGAGYIDTAFQTARQADKNALLFYNDYAIEGMNDKSNAVYNMVSSMITRGIPIDGVGMQMHYGTFTNAPTAADFAQNLKRFTDLGIKVVLSEMDVNCCDGFTIAQEATLYHDIVAACVDSNPGCWAITVWGISDKDSWLNSYSKSGCSSGMLPTPLMWDNSFAKKSAYTGMMNALIGQ
jgi:endo-1,4-beta-xylanase